MTGTMYLMKIDDRPINHSIGSKYMARILKLVYGFIGHRQKKKRMNIFHFFQDFISCTHLSNSSQPYIICIRTLHVPLFCLNSDAVRSAIIFVPRFISINVIYPLIHLHAACLLNKRLHNCTSCTHLI